MAKTLILLPIWKRERITKLCLGNLKRLKEKYDIDVLCIVSEQWAKIEAIKHGFKQVYASNDDLGQKMNIGVKEALDYQFDYLMNLGSDDIITERLFELYEPFIQDRLAMFGCRKVTFIDSESKEVKEKDYKIMIGAGRMIRRDVLKDCVLRNDEVDMYDKGIERGLDLNSLKRFRRYSHTELENGFDCIYDIKSKENIWNFVELKGQKVPFDKVKLETELIDEILDL